MTKAEALELLILGGGGLLSQLAPVGTIHPGGTLLELALPVSVLFPPGGVRDAAPVAQ